MQIDSNHQLLMMYLQQTHANAISHRTHGNFLLDFPLRNIPSVEVYFKETRSIVRVVIHAVLEP